MQQFLLRDTKIEIIPFEKKELITSCPDICFKRHVCDKRESGMNYTTMV